MSFVSNFFLKSNLTHSYIGLEQNMNLFMTPYKVLASGFKLGYIEFVRNSRDLVKIHRKFSYNCGLSIHNKCLVNWLTDKIEKEVKFEIKMLENSSMNDDADNEKRLTEEQLIGILLLFNL
jgi:hypothetical protein